MSSTRHTISDTSISCIDTVAFGVVSVSKTRNNQHAAVLASFLKKHPLVIIAVISSQRLNRARKSICNVVEPINARYNLVYKHKVLMREKGM
jgi:hypothetical protein